ncbi:MAG: T9SS type A sorting domain-containing protein [Bacteroidetes bacterium]|nr:T9SS type A sorting domain-containing protein [Bacteroidota bacterium]
MCKKKLENLNTILITKKSQPIAGQDSNKWFATWGSGISKFDGTNWTTFNTSNSGLVNDTVLSITIDAQGNKWFGTAAGISKFNGTTWTTYKTGNSGLTNNYVISISIDTLGNKWFGTWGGGVSKFNGTTWTTYKMNNSGLPNDTILAIAIDKKGNKWFATFGGGISKFNGNTWITYNTSNSGLVDDNTYSILIDAQNSKWFGTFGGGVSKFDDDPLTIKSVSFLDKPTLVISPNPAKSILNITTTTTGKDLVVYDITGKHILHQLLTKEKTTIDISTLSAGVYIYEYSGEKGKLIKE